MYNEFILAITVVFVDRPIEMSVRSYLIEK